MADATFNDDAGVTGGFPLPFSQLQLRADIQEILLLYSRQLYQVFARNEICLPEQQSILRLPAEVNVNEMDLGPADLGMRYEALEGTAMAQALEALYDYAFRGIVDLSREAMESDSEATWCSVLIHDLANSAFARELSAHNPIGDQDELGGPIERCLLVCETAQARRVLEGHDDNFMDWAATISGGLTVRQVALLSGMTESSVRTLANPKRRNALITVNDGKNVKVEIESAKTWLKAKGRYVPVTRMNRAGQLDLSSHRFGNCDELALALDQRLQFVWGQGDSDMLRRRFAAQLPDLLDESRAEQPALRLTSAQLADHGLMATVADVLGLPGDLLALRASEACAREALAEIEQRIQRTLKSDADRR